MKIELDTVTDGMVRPGTAFVNAAATAQIIVTDYPNVTYRVVTESGPAGGNPIIAYRGPRAQLEAMVHAHYGADTAEMMFVSKD